MYGICVDTQISLFIALVARCFWQYDTQLAGLPLTYIEMSIALLVQSGLLYLCTKYTDILYKGIKQVFLKWYVLVAVSMVLAGIFHPGKKG